MSTHQCSLKVRFATELYRNKCVTAHSVVTVMMLSMCDVADSDQWPGDEAAQLASSPGGKAGGSDAEESVTTETVTNGSMKETVSLTVDAKTETAIFKR